MEVEVENIWHVKTTWVPGIVGTLSVINKGTEKHIN